MNILISGCGGGGTNPLLMEYEDHYILEDKITPNRFIAIDANPYMVAHSVADKSYVVPRADAGTEKYGTAINRIANQENIDLFIPNSYVEVGFASRKIGLLPPMFLPDREAVATCQDKLRFYEKMKGFPLARTEHPRAYHNLLKSIEVLGGVEKDLWIRSRYGAGATAATKVRSYEEVKWWISYWVRHRGMKIEDFLLHEFLPGRDIIVASTWMKGVCVWQKSFEKCGYYEGAFRPSGKSSTGIIDKPFYDEEIFELCLRMAYALDLSPQGNFTFDFKQDAEGRWICTECNIGRFIQGTKLLNVGINWLDIFIQAFEGKAEPQHPEAAYRMMEGLVQVRAGNQGLSLVEERDVKDLVEEE